MKLQIILTFKVKAAQSFEGQRYVRDILRFIDITA